MTVKIDWRPRTGAAPRTATVSFTGLSDEHPPDPDFLLPLLLIPAMAADRELVLPGLASAALSTRAREIQSIFATWYPDRLQRVAIRQDASGRERSVPNPPGEGRAAAFFSGGADSFYTALALRSELDALIYVAGFDHTIGRPAEPDDREIFNRVSHAADRLGLPLIGVRTSLRRFSDQLVLWGDHYVGSALASVAILLSRLFSVVYVPATHTYADLFPYGTHPLTDPLWSTEHTQIRVHGADVTRPAKIAALRDSQVALDTLRVCWENFDGAYNCGLCRKCTLTALSLWLVDALDRCPTLPHEIDLEAVARVDADDESGRAFLRMARDAVRGDSRPEAAAIEQLLTAALSRSEARAKVR